MAVSDDYLRWVLDQLSGIGGLSSRRMFGAVGLYRDASFFGIISGDVLYFKVGDDNRIDYEARGMARFRPYRDKPHLSMNYYEVPADVLEDPEQCVQWAQNAVAAATPRAAARTTRVRVNLKRAHTFRD